MTPTTPRKKAELAFEKYHYLPKSLPRSQRERPISEATEFVETDVEDDDSSVFEEDSENSGSSQCDSVSLPMLVVVKISSHS